MAWKHTYKEHGPWWRTINVSTPSSREIIEQTIITWSRFRRTSRSLFTVDKNTHTPRSFLSQYHQDGSKWYQKSNPRRKIEGGRIIQVGIHNMYYYGWVIQQPFGYYQYRHIKQDYVSWKATQNPSTIMWEYSTTTMLVRNSRGPLQWRKNLPSHIQAATPRQAKPKISGNPTVSIAVTQTTSPTSV